MEDSLSLSQLQEKPTTANAKSDTFELGLISGGLVDVSSLDSDIVVELRYSTDNNFLHRDFYGNFNKCYLQPDVAEKLLLAQSLLKSRYPAYNIIVYDAARPLNVQYEMWNALKMPLQEKIKYLSNPKYGSLHNYGAAVDVGIVDRFGTPIDMGTDFDYFGELAYPIREEQMLEAGLLSKIQLENRHLLKDVMEDAGFFNIQTEWWHFNSCYRKEARIKYKLIR